MARKVGRKSAKYAGEQALLILRPHGTACGELDRSVPPSVLRLGQCRSDLIEALLQPRRFGQQLIARPRLALADPQLPDLDGLGTIRSEFDIGAREYRRNHEAGIGMRQAQFAIRPELPQAVAVGGQVG
jgi:hypothetical protein